MKIYTVKFYFYGSKQQVPLNYMNQLLSFLHKDVLGDDNELHDSMSMYSVSPLFNCNKNAKAQDEYTVFDKGAIMLIRTPDFEIYKRFLFSGKKAITKKLGFGLVLKEVTTTVKNFEDFGNVLTSGASPIYLGDGKKNYNIDGDITHEHADSISSEVMTRIFITKTSKLGYNYTTNDINISFNRESSLKRKRVIIGTASNIATLGKVKITGKNSDVIALAYGLGIGKSTGCGFGFMYNI